LINKRFNFDFEKACEDEEDRFALFFEQFFILYF